MRRKSRSPSVAPRGLDEFFEVARVGGKASAEVEQPGGALPLEENAVAADFPRRAAVDSHLN